MWPAATEAEAQISALHICARKAWTFQTQGSTWTGFQRGSSKFW
jgi:hypothetical protein